MRSHADMIVIIPSPVFVYRNLGKYTYMFSSIPETEEGDEETFKTQTSLNDMSEH